MRKTALFLELARRMVGARFTATVLEPTLADVQHETSVATGHGARWNARVGGLVAIIRATLLYGTLLPVRHLREVWLAPDAPGPRFATDFLLRFLVYGALSLVPTWLRTLFRMPQLSATTAALVLSHVALFFLPLAFAVALAWALRGADEGRVRASAALAPAVALSGILYWAYVDPEAGWAYKRGVFQELHGETLSSAARGLGMTSSADLAEWIPKWEEKLRAQPDDTRAARALASLRIEWHRRLAWPLLTLPLALLVTAWVTRGGHPLAASLIVAGLVVPLYFLLRYGNIYADFRHLPPALVAWSPHVAAWLLVALARLRSEPRVLAR